MHRVLRAIAVFLISAAAVPLATTATVLGAFLFLPLPASLPEPKAGIDSQVSHIYDIDGNEIGTFHKFETSIPFRKEDVPLVLKQAVVASEDRNFYKHGGVDLRGTIRAFWADYRNRKVVQGGSTITQQYVKNAYTGGERTILRKLKEAILASQLDRQFDKDEILYRYLSTIYLGNGAYGVEAASELYFHHPVTQITASEAALLAGLIPAPSRYEPLGNPAVAEARRRAALEKMYQQHYLTFDQLAQAHSQGLWFGDNPQKPSGPATLVYRPRLEQNRYPYFRDYVERYLKDRYGDQLYSGGLKIQTTLDSKVQDLAEKTVADQLAGTSAPLDMALVAVEPPTGYVKALVGGRDFYRGSQVNLALGGCPRHPTNPRIVVQVEPACWSDTGVIQGGGLGRQPGSAFKPYVLATAFSEGITPSKVYEAPQVFHIPNCRGDTCTIGNNEGEGGGSSDLRHALWHSINTVYAQLVRDVGCKQTAETAKKLGITSAWYSPQFHTCSGTYALGVIDVSPLDMASAYGVFGNGGKRAEPTPVLKVVDVHGRVLEDHTKPDTPQVIDQVIADNVTDVMKGVITSGTGTAADIGRPAAGKTGTTENFTNAWFVGFTPTLSTAVWMGYSNNQTTPLRNIKGVGRVFGGTIPAQTWHDFMSQALKDVPVTDFNQPAPIKPVATDLLRQARGGIDAGDRRYPDGTPANCGGPCEINPPRPTAVPPTTFAPTTTTEPSSAGDTGPPPTFFPSG